MNVASLDAVTIDAHGTLISVRDPVPRLVELSGRDVEAVRRGFRAETAYYVERTHHGRDAASLAQLRAECVGVFNEAAGAELSADEYVGTLEFERVPGAFEAVERIRALGLAFGVVSNWDYTLVDLLPHDWVIVTSADVGVPKPAPEIFRVALDRLGVEPERALHVGDGDADDRGASAAGMRFAPAPLAGVVSAW